MEIIRQNMVAAWYWYICPACSVWCEQNIHFGTGSQNTIRTDGIFKANFPNLYTAAGRHAFFCFAIVAYVVLHRNIVCVERLNLNVVYTREQLVNNVWIIQKLCGCGTPYKRVFQISMFEVKCGIEFKWSSLGFLFWVFKCWSQNGNDKLFIY